MLGTIALAALAKSTRATCLTSDGAGDQSWYRLLVQEFLDLNAGKTPVQEQAMQRDIKLLHLLQQMAQDIDFTCPGQHKADTQSQAQSVRQDVGRGQTIKASRPILYLHNCSLSGP